MQTFRQLFKDKTCNAGFHDLYQQECNVCPFTVRIFEKVDAQQIDLPTLAQTLDLPVESIRDLMDADCCDPRIVIDLCRHLGLDAPESCPKWITE